MIEMLVNNELECTWKEDVVSQMQVLSRKWAKHWGKLQAC